MTREVKLLVAGGRRSLTVKIRQVGQCRYEDVPRLVDGAPAQRTGLASGGACATSDDMPAREKHMVDGGVHADPAREGVDELGQFIAIPRAVGGFGRRRPVRRRRAVYRRRRDFVLFLVERAARVVVHFTTSPLYVEHVFLS